MTRPDPKTPSVMERFKHFAYPHKSFREAYDEANKINEGMPQVAQLETHHLYDVATNALSIKTELENTDENGKTVNVSMTNIISNSIEYNKAQMQTVMPLLELLYKDEFKTDVNNADRLIIKTHVHSTGEISSCFQLITDIDEQTKESSVWIQGFKSMILDTPVAKDHGVDLDIRELMFGAMRSLEFFGATSDGYATENERKDVEKNQRLMEDVKNLMGNAAMYESIIAAISRNEDGEFEGDASQIDNAVRLIGGFTAYLDHALHTIIGRLGATGSEERNKILDVMITRKFKQLKAEVSEVLDDMMPPMKECIKADFDPLLLANAGVASHRVDEDLDRLLREFKDGLMH